MLWRGEPGPTASRGRSADAPRTSRRRGASACPSARAGAVSSTSNAHSVRECVGIKCLCQRSAAPAHGQAGVALWRAEPRPTTLSIWLADSAPNKPKARGERLPVRAGRRCVTRRARLIPRADVAGIKRLCFRAAAPPHGQAGVAPWRGEPRPTTSSISCAEQPPDKPQARGERLPVPAGWRSVTRRATLIQRGRLAGQKLLCPRAVAPPHRQAHVAPLHPSPRMTKRSAFLPRRGVYAGRRPQERHPWTTTPSA